MSAEGKKKRGVSGASKGKAAPFRLFGGGCHPKHLAQVMRTIGNEVEKIGRPRDGSAWDRGARKAGKLGGQGGLTYAEATALEEGRR